MSDAQRPAWLNPSHGSVRPPPWASPSSSGVRAVFAREELPPPPDTSDEQEEVAVEGSLPEEQAPPPRSIAPSRLRSSIPAPRPSSLPREFGLADAQLREAQHAFAEAAVAMATARADALSGIEADLRALAIDIAEAILGAEVIARPELHANLVKSAIEALEPQAPTKLRVSRESWQAVIDAYGGPTIELEGGAHVNVVLDPNLDGLGCVAEAGDTRVDGRIRERLERVRRAFVEAESQRDRQGR